MKKVARGLAPIFRPGQQAVSERAIAKKAIGPRDGQYMFVNCRGGHTFGMRGGVGAQNARFEQTAVADETRSKTLE
jgi:hypothetical protein